MVKADRLDKTIEAAGKLMELGERNQLGGDGEPVAIVLVYKNQAFINASWGGTPEDRSAALIDAAAGEGLKTK